MENRITKLIDKIFSKYASKEDLVVLCKISAIWDDAANKLEINYTVDPRYTMPMGKDRVIYNKLDLLKYKAFLKHWNQLSELVMASFEDHVKTSAIVRGMAYEDQKYVFITRDHKIVYYQLSRVPYDDYYYLSTRNERFILDLRAYTDIDLELARQDNVIITINNITKGVKKDIKYIQEQVNCMKAKMNTLTEPSYKTEAEQILKSIKIEI